MVEYSSSVRETAVQLKLVNYLLSLVLILRAKYGGCLVELNILRKSLSPNAALNTLGPLITQKSFLISIRSDEDILVKNLIEVMKNPIHSGRSPDLGIST